MKATFRFLIAGLLLCHGLPMRSEGHVLNPGDSLVFQFTSLSLVQTLPYDNWDMKTIVDLPYLGNLDTSFRIEFFENSITDLPFYSTTLYGRHPLFLPNNSAQFIFYEPFPWTDMAWLDQQGAIRFTGISGSASLDELRIRVFSRRNWYGDVFLVPEPSSWVLLLSGLALFRLCFRK